MCHRNVQTALCKYTPTYTLTVMQGTLSQKIKEQLTNFSSNKLLYQLVE